MKVYLLKAWNILNEWCTIAHVWPKVVISATNTSKYII